MGRPTFADWLAEALETDGIGNRTLARRLAEQHPAGATLDTIETYRRAIRRIRKGDLSPRDPLRASIADALGRGDHPVVADEADPDDLEATLAELARARPKLARELLKAFSQ